MASLYRHFDGNGALLYVGISVSALSRLMEHRRRSGWFSEIRKITVQTFATREEAFEAEALAILQENPRHNVARAAITACGACYPNIYAAAKACGVSPHVARYHMTRYGMTFEEFLASAKNKAASETPYRSVRAAALECGVSQYRIRHLMVRKNMTLNEALHAAQPKASPSLPLEERTPKMSKITISADTLDELLEIVDSLVGLRSADAPAPAAAGEAPKRQSRKKAEAPAPIQPEPAAGGNPFGAAPAAAPAAEPANPFAAAPGAAPAGPTFAPGAADPHANFTAERPAVTKFKELLSKIASQHGEPAVYGWAIKAFGLSPSVTKDEFLSKLIHDQSDDALALAYKQGGGQP